ncbi:MAG TPA: bestrophin family ion channel [Myxococcaceae bacterium]|nr:bestrophin family ion channel [Myxococcaceae bacterium]
MYVRRDIQPLLTLRYAWRAVLQFTLYAVVVCVLHEELKLTSLAIPSLPLTTLGIVVSFTIGFKNNSAYDRFWEARTLWGRVVNTSRSWTVQILSFIHGMPGTQDPRAAEALEREFIYRQLAWVHALRIHLRKQDGWEEVQKFVSPAEWEDLRTKTNIPAQLLAHQGSRLRQFLGHSGLGRELLHLELIRNIDELYDLQGGCERIKNTPFPRQYGYYSKVFVQLFCLILPFGFVASLGWLTIPLSVLVSWTFFTLERVGDTSEDPFENKINDVPMSAICRAIEIDLREMLKEKDIPKPLAPVEGVLL